MARIRDAARIFDHALREVLPPGLVIRRLRTRSRIARWRVCSMKHSDGVIYDVPCDEMESILACAGEAALQRRAVGLVAAINQRHREGLATADG